MGKTKGSRKPRETKTYFTEQELEAMEQFRRTKTSLKSRNEMFHTAIAYFMEQIERSGGIVNAKGFPVILADLQQPQPLVEQNPVRRPQSA